MDDVKTSKLLSFVLRHKPEEIGITLDAGGWVDIDKLLDALGAAKHSVSEADLRKVAKTSDKARFTISDDGLRIRAAQGHSVPVDLGLAPSVPPAVLYHGTATRNLSAIRAEGLTPRSRNHVHLSEDRVTATKVGQRYRTPIVLSVAAAEMQADGRTFYQAENGVWLTDHVAPKYLSGFDEDDVNE